MGSTIQNVYRCVDTPYLENSFYVQEAAEDFDPMEKKWILTIHFRTLKVPGVLIGESGKSCNIFFDFQFFEK